jgi:hypothetical protein
VSAITGAGAAPSSESQRQRANRAIRSEFARVDYLLPWAFSDTAIQHNPVPGWESTIRDNQRPTSGHPAV